MGWLEGLFLGAFAFGLMMSVASVLIGGHPGHGHDCLRAPPGHAGHGLHLSGPHLSHAASLAHGGLAYVEPWETFVGGRAGESAGGR